MQRTQPAALTVLFADGRNYQQVAGARCRDVGDAQRFLFIGATLRFGGIEQFPGRAPQQALRTEARVLVAEAVAALRRAQVASEVGEDDHGKLQPLGLVDGHQFDAAALLF